jgi:hypothetical protein
MSTAAVPLFPFDNERLVGTVSEVAPTSARANLPQAASTGGEWLYGNRMGRGEVGEFVVIECGASALFGRIVAVRLPERERLAIEPELGRQAEAHPVGTIQLLTSIDIRSSSVLGGITSHPRIGAKVYTAHPSLIKWIAESPKAAPRAGPATKPDVALGIGALTNEAATKISVTPERLFGRHCAVLGATGGGKSWTIARLLEEASKYACKLIVIDATGEFYTLGTSAVHIHVGAAPHGAPPATEVAVPHSELTESDLFALFRPSGQTQVPKLRAAMKSLKLAKKDAKLATAQGLIAKAEKPRGPYEAALVTHAKALDHPRADFDVAKLSKQIFEECVWPTSKMVPANWGLANDQEKSYCVSLVSRIEDMVQSTELACIFAPASKTSVFKAIDDFLSTDVQKVLRISMKYVPFVHHARDVLVNAIGRYILLLGRQERFRTQPLIVFLDEAHQFLNKSLDDEYARYPLDAFDLIAKEGRKYGLNVCFATQRPRDISEGVLSQVGTLIVHRLTNDRDREVVERASGDIDKSAAAFLPTLSPGEAVIIGVEFPFPVTVAIQEPTLKPDSKGPDYQKAWAV